MILVLEKILEKEWNSYTSNDQQEMIEELVSFVLTGFRAGLQEEEVPLVSLRGLLHFWHETRLDPDPFIMITLFGQF